MTRILLVDDDDKLVPLLQRGLAHQGFEVYTARDGATGIETARSCRPHVVLLDIAMPGPDGFEVCRSLRLREDTAIIMLTVRDGPAHMAGSVFGKMRSGTLTDLDQNHGPRRLSIP